jgi:hypothetical protein
VSFKAEKLHGKVLKTLKGVTTNFGDKIANPNYTDMKKCITGIFGEMNGDNIVGIGFIVWQPPKPKTAA